FSFTDHAARDFYPLSLHDALPICAWSSASDRPRVDRLDLGGVAIHAEERLRAARALPPHPPGAGGVAQQAEDRVGHPVDIAGLRSEEHTSELQSRENLVCRLLLEK